MVWTVKYEPRVLRQLRKLDPQIADRITNNLESRIAAQTDPRIMGTMLVAQLQGLWRFRVGDYRVLCEIHDAELIILAVGIGHRRDVYQ